MGSIFELENRLNIDNEFNKMAKVLHDTQGVYLKKVHRSISFWNFVDFYLFKNWKYRDTFLDTTEYLCFLNVWNRKNIDEQNFLYYLEFILNMLQQRNGTTEFETEFSDTVKACLNNIPLILEKMNYVMENNEDKIILRKRNADVDSVIRIIKEENIKDSILEYNDFRYQNDIEKKKTILKRMDLYIEKNINLKSFDNKLDNAIGTLVNELGINHPANDKYSFITNNDNELIEWYDKCFLLMLHAMRIPAINEIKKERDDLIKKNS